MRKVICMNDGKEYIFKTDSSKTAIMMMKHFLDIGCKDAGAAIANDEEAYYMKHGDKVYVCYV